MSPRILRTVMTAVALPLIACGVETSNEAGSSEPNAEIGEAPPRAEAPSERRDEALPPTNAPPGSDPAAPQPDISSPQASANEAEAAPPPITAETWMERSPKLAKVPFHKIAIPGTHDSATYSLASVYSRPTSDPFAPDAPGFLAKAGQFAFVSEPWAKAQNLTLGEQLARGARYLDLRPCAEVNGTLRSCHGMYGPLMSDLLTDVRNFVAQHPQEIVLLNMQSFAGMSAQHHAALRALIDDKLGRHLLDWSHKEFSPSMKLEEIWAHAGKSVVVIYDSDERAPAYMPGYELPKTWTKAIWERDDKRAELLSAYSVAGDSLWVLPASATPDEGGKLIGYSMVPGSSHPDSLEELADATNPVVQQWLRDEWRWANIVTVDFIEKTCLFEVTQQLNGVEGVSFTGCNIGETSWGNWQIGPYGRGAGSPLQCAPGQEMRDGLCYVPCSAGFKSPPLFPYLCVRECPAGYRDDGLTCFRDAKIIASDHDSCPAYDVCGVWLAKGCSSCPSGYSNDGCTCRRDPHMLTKAKYNRGTGTIPRSCPPGTEMDGLLCYPLCKSGFTGHGPICVP